MEGRSISMAMHNYFSVVSTGFLNSSYPVVYSNATTPKSLVLKAK
jgi:hypothetical protein